MADTYQQARERMADHLDGLADRMQETIDHKRAPLSQNWTPRRARIKEGQIADAAKLETVQRGLRGLALAHRENRVPGCLAGVETKTAVERILLGPQAGRYGQKRQTLMELAEAAIDAETLAADAAREEELELRRAEDELRTHRPPGFFPTPPAVVDRIMELLSLDLKEWGVNWLEPSAGMGHLAKPILDAVRDIRDFQKEAGLDSRKRSTLTLIEKDPRLFDYLARCHFDIPDEVSRALQGDCLEVLKDTGETFERIAMNPPFERRQDEEHVLAMYDRLTPTWGRLVSVMTPRGAETVQAKLGGWIEELPEGSFKGSDAFRQTGVRCVLYCVER